MEIYLPIAEMSARWLVLLGMGATVGFLSGMFGVGGGFLLTPLLIFYGVPAEVAVAANARPLTAPLMAGAGGPGGPRGVGLLVGGGVGWGGLGRPGVGGGPCAWVRQRRA